MGDNMGTRKKSTNVRLSKGIRQSLNPVGLQQTDLIANLPPLQTREFSPRFYHQS